MMRIGELATRTHVSVRALRYYEEHALLTAERTPSGQRHYPESAVARVHLIQQLYAHAASPAAPSATSSPASSTAGPRPNSSTASPHNATTSPPSSPPSPPPATPSTE